MFKEALILGSFAMGGADNNAAVPLYPNVLARVESLNQDKEDYPPLIQNSESSFDVSQFDPSEFPLSGRIFTGLVCFTLIAVAYDKWKRAEKLTSDSDIRFSDKSVATLVFTTALYTLVETFSDFPY